VPGSIKPAIRDHHAPQADVVAYSAACRQTFLREITVGQIGRIARVLCGCWPKGMPAVVLLANPFLTGQGALISASTP